MRLYSAFAPLAIALMAVSHGHPHPSAQPRYLSIFSDDGTWPALDELDPKQRSGDAFSDPPRLPIPAHSSSDGGEWWTRWLNVGGEGELIVKKTKHVNLTLPHRPAAFPNDLPTRTTLPLHGKLHLFQSFLNESESDESTNEFVLTAHAPGLACLPPLLPGRIELPKEPFHFALVERGECDFASKVRAAQERGAAGVVVGDGVLREDETDEEGFKRENLITMFSPEDTDGIVIPSVFVSRASFLTLRDMIANATEASKWKKLDGDVENDPGVWIEIGSSEDDGATLSSLLSFALLMPTIFLLVTIAAHRIRLARMREAERAPALVVFSLPERIWTPDIVWEKDSDSESNQHGDEHDHGHDTDPQSPGSLTSSAPTIMPESPSPARSTLPPPPFITPAQVATPEEEVPPTSAEASGSKKKKTSGKKYYGKDECAICMDAFQRGDMVRILPCGHVFHKDECDEWLLKWRKLCPTCRADVTLPPGAVAQGTTLTPVAIPQTDGAEVVDDEDVFHRPLTSRVVHAVRASWGRLLGRRVRIGVADERTPLVPAPSSPRTGDRAV